MQVVKDERARDGLIELTLDDAEIDDVGCILILDVQLDVVRVCVDGEDDVDIRISMSVSLLSMWFLLWMVLMVSLSMMML